MTKKRGAAGPKKRSKAAKPKGRPKHDIEVPTLADQETQMIDFGFGNCELHVMGPDAHPWAQERMAAFLGQLHEVEDAIGKWIPNFYEETDTEMVTDVDDLLDALEIEVLGFSTEHGEHVIWMSTNVWNGLDDLDESALCTLNITVEFDGDLNINGIGVDG